MKPFLQRHRLHLTPLSPLHLGTGEDFEPTNYVIHENLLYAFDPAQAVLSEHERKELLAASKSGDMQTIQKFFAQHATPFMRSAISICGVSEALAKEYQSKLGEVVQREQRGRNVSNLLRIERTATNPHTHQPYIPGSALKGCLRTAIMEEASVGSPPREDLSKKNAAFRYENELLGSFSTDLLRLLKPADFTAQADILTHIQYATNHKKREVKVNGQIQTAKGPSGRRETIEHGQYRAFTGECLLQNLETQHQPQLKNAEKTYPQKKKLAMQHIAIAANQYHRKRFQKESTILAQRRLVNEKWLQSTRALLKAIEPQLENGEILLLRLGKNGGAESKTLEKYAQIKIMGGKGQPPSYEKETKTVWLAAQHEKANHDMLPFGWALVEIDPQEDNSAIRQWCDANSAHLHNAAVIRATLADNRQKQQEQLAQFAQQQAEKAQQQAEQQAAAAAEQARIANLSAEERQIYDWQQEADTIAKRIRQPSEQLAVDFIATLMTAIAEAQNNPQMDNAARCKLADAITGLQLKSRGMLSDRKAKALNSELQKLRGANP